VNVLSLMEQIQQTLLWELVIPELAILASELAMVLDCFK